MARVVEVLRQGGQVRVGLGNDAVAVEDDGSPIGVGTQDLGGIDVARGVDLGLLVPNDRADGADDRQDDGGNARDHNNSDAAIGALLRLTHLCGLGAHRIEGRLRILSHELTFRDWLNVVRLPIRAESRLVQQATGEGDPRTRKESDASECEQGASP